jgi:hypothetical protein
LIIDGKNATLKRLFSLRWKAKIKIYIGVQ